MVNGPVFDRNAAMALVDGRRDILLDLAKTFLEYYPTLLSPLEEAIREADHRALAGAAHDLKGSLGFFGPTLAAASAAELEQMAVQGNQDGIFQTHAALQRHIEGLVASLKELLAGA